MPGKITGTINIDSLPAERPVIAITAKKEPVIGGDPAYQVVGSALSSAADGSYEINMSYEQPCFLLAIDDYGDEYKNNTTHAIGDRVHPTVPNGYVYECTAAGTTGSNEPVWWVDDGNNPTNQVGSATFAVYPYYRPLAHGAITPVYVEGSNPVLDFSNPDLICAYTMDNISGVTLVDQAGGGVDGTINGAAAVAGLIGDCLSFNGSSNNVTLPTDFYRRAFALSLWFNSSDNSKSIITAGESRGSNSVRSFDVFGTGGTNQLAFILSANGSSALYLTAAYPTTGEWHHLVVQWNGSTGAGGAKLYIDGVLQGSAAVSSTSIDLKTLRLGGNAGSASYSFSGLMDQVRVFDRPLTDQEILQLAGEASV